MDSENRPICAIYKNTCFVCVKETHTKHMFDREKTDDNLFGGLCLPLYYSTLRYFEIKYLVPRTSNLRVSTVLFFIFSCVVLFCYILLIYYFTDLNPLKV